MRKLILVAILSFLIPATASAGGPLFNNPLGWLMRAFSGDQMDRQQLINEYRRNESTDTANDYIPDPNMGRPRCTPPGGCMGGTRLVRAKR